MIGAGAVTVFDGRVSYTNAPDAFNEDVLAVIDSEVHVLPAGYGLDLKTLRPRLSGGAEIAAA